MDTVNNAVVEELFKINAYTQNAVATASSAEKNPTRSNIGQNVWEMAYNLVFSKDCAQRADALFKKLNIHFDYYDPDMDYNDDVLAYANALNSACEQIALFHPKLSETYFPNLLNDNSNDGAQRFKV